MTQLKTLLVHVIAWAIALSTIFYYYKKADHAIIENSRIVNNNKSLERGMLTFKDDSARTHYLTVQQQKTIAELKYSSDTSTIALMNRINSYKIKLGTITDVATVSTQLKHDTTFVPAKGKDTTYNLSHNPQTKHSITIKGDSVTDSLEVNNVQDLVMHGKKETIEPPKKFFLCRWFQKKHIVVSGEVINSNKDIKVKDQKFIKVIDVK